MTCLREPGLLEVRRDKGEEGFELGLEEMEGVGGPTQRRGGQGVSFSLSFSFVFFIWREGRRRTGGPY